MAMISGQFYAVDCMRENHYVNKSEKSEQQQILININLKNMKYKEFRVVLLIIAPSPSSFSLIFFSSFTKKISSGDVMKAAFTINLIKE